MNEQEIWYEIEVSRANDDDWYRYGNDHYDTENSARLLIALLSKEAHAAPSNPEWTAPNGKYCSYHRRIAYLLRMARRSKGNVRRQKGVPKWKGL